MIKAKFMIHITDNLGINPLPFPFTCPLQEHILWPSVPHLLQRIRHALLLILEVDGSSTSPFHYLFGLPGGLLIKGGSIV